MADAVLAQKRLLLTIFQTLSRMLKSINLKSVNMILVNNNNVFM